MKNIIRLLVYSNLLIAFAAGLLSKSIAYSLNVDNSNGYFGLVFGATLFVYNAQRIFRLPQLTGTLSPRHKWILNHKKAVVLFSFIGLAIGLFWFIRDFFSVYSIIFFSIFGLVSLLYSIKIENYFPPLRDIPFLKIHWVALTWTATSSLFPILESTNYTNLAYAQYYLLAAVYMYFVAITIPFDIRDLPYDLPKQKTIPQILGVKSAVVLSIILLIAAFIFLSLHNKQLLKSTFFYGAFIYQLILLIFSFRKQKELYYSAGIDGGIILFALCFFASIP
jgi:hypothetical protein